MLTTSLLLALAMAADAPAAAAATDPYIPNCHITLIDDQPVPAADAGVLTILKVTKGSRVTEGQEIGLIDDAEARAVLEIRRLEYDTAQKTADSDIDIRHAKMASQVAKQAYLFLEAANKGVRGTVTAIDILRAQLEWERSKLAIEQAMEQNIEAKLTAIAKNAEVGAAQVALDRRTLRAPFDGVVVKVVKEPGEWVAPGDPVVEVVGIKRLRVVGSLNAGEWAPADIEGRKVTVEVTLPRGEKVTVHGRITFVSPVVKSRELPVSADIETQAKGGQLLVRAGLPAAMTIHVSQPVAASAPATPTRATPVRQTTKQARKK